MFCFSFFFNIQHRNIRICTIYTKRGVKARPTLYFKLVTNKPKLKIWWKETQKYFCCLDFSLLLDCQCGHFCPVLTTVTYLTGCLQVLFQIYIWRDRQRKREKERAIRFCVSGWFTCWFSSGKASQLSHLLHIKQRTTTKRQTWTFDKLTCPVSACKSQSIIRLSISQRLCVCARGSESWQKQINCVFIFHTTFGSAVRWYDNSAISHKQRLINGAAEPFVLLQAADLFLFVVWPSFPFDRSSIMAFHHRPASLPSRIITQMSLMLKALRQMAHSECDLRPEWFAPAHKLASYRNFIFSEWNCVFSVFQKQRFSRWVWNVFPFVYMWKCEQFFMFCGSCSKARGNHSPNVHNHGSLRPKQHPPCSEY